MSHRNENTLLIVDDEALIREILKDIAEQTGVSVEEAGNGVEALEKLAKGSYCGVLTDISMPKMDGLSLLQAIRAGGNNVPVVVVTGYADDEKVQRALALGALGYIEKPFDDERVLSALKKVLDNPAVKTV